MVAQLIQKQIEKFGYGERKIFWTLFLVAVLLVISYGFLLNSTMMHAVSKQRMEKEILALGSEVNLLEFKYLNTKNSITIGLAHAKGFIAVSSDKFATINSIPKNLSLSINEN